MPLVHLPTPLAPYANKQETITVHGHNVQEVLDGLIAVHSDLRKQIFSDQGGLRNFLNVYVNDADIRHLQGLQTAVKEGDELMIVPSIAGALALYLQGIDQKPVGSYSLNEDTTHQETDNREHEKLAVPEMTPEDLKNCLDQGQDFLLLDVREPHEHDICHIETALLIPFAELEERASELDKSRDIVIHCKTGGRSARAVRLLNRLGFRKAVSLRGGIDAWSERIDRTLPRY